jgi:hypothetical protein
VNTRLGTIALAEAIISWACRVIPEDDRAERTAEWSAELPAIITDSAVKFAWARRLKAISFTVGIVKAVNETYREVDGHVDLPMRLAMASFKLSAIGEVVGLVPIFSWLQSWSFMVSWLVPILCMFSRESIFTQCRRQRSRVRVR